MIAGIALEHCSDPCGRLVKIPAILVLLLCCPFAGCGIYENSDNLNYGWSEFHRDQATCQREHSHWVATGSMGAMEDKLPEPSVVDACLATRGWRRTNAYPALTVLFPSLPSHTSSMP